MLRFLADENFNGDIVRGLLLLQAEIDLLRVQDVGLAGADDPRILAWAGENDRILLTHDGATMPDHAYDRVEAGERMPGVFVVHGRFPVGLAIQEIVLMAGCSQQAEWRGHVVHLPL